MGRLPRTILIVDDSPEDREFYRRCLLRDQDYAYTILETDLGQHGLDLWHRHQPNVLLLDYHLPDLDGLDFLAKLQSATPQPCLPIVVVTGQGNEAIAVQAMKLGAQDYLVKEHITSTELQLTVNGAIATAQLHTQLQQRDAQLKESENRYHTLFESMEDGFCIIELLFDETNTPIDYRFLEINPAFEQQTGLEQAVGKTARQLVPDLEEHWFEIYGKVALTGEPLRFENGSDAMKRWFDVYAFRIEQPESRKVAILFKEISDRKLAEQQLRESEEQLRTGVQVAGIGLAKFDYATNMVALSPEAAVLYGFSPEELVVSREQIHATFHPDERAELEETIAQVLDPQGTGWFAKVHRVVWPNGEVRHLSVRKKVFFDFSGVVPRPSYAVLAAIDISAQKQTEDALRESEDRFRRVIMESPLPLILHAEDGEVVMLNTAWTESSGYQPEEIPTLDEWIKRAYGARGNIVKEGMNKLYNLKSRVREGEFTIRTRSGETRIWDFSSAGLGKMPDGRRLVISTALDVTDRKEAEQALRQSQAQFRATFEQAAVGIAHVGLEGRWLRVNQKLCDIVGYSAAELAELTFQDITHPDDLETDLACMRQLLAGEIQTYSIEKRYFHKSGEAVWIELTVSLVREESEDQNDLAVMVGEPQYLISVIEEINDRKQAKAELEARSRELSQFNGLLAQAAVLLDERNQELDRFVHIVSHDLKAPLRAISNLSQWIEEDLEGELSIENQQQMALLRDRVHRMQAMIDGLLAYARAGRTEADLEPVAVAELLAEVIDSLDPPSAFSIEIASEMPILHTKRLLLSQVFANLISNGIKHHHRPNGRIRVSSQEKGDFYEFAVADDGPGIAPEHHEKIFMIFQSVNPQNSQDSSGIGLSIVKKIVETEEGTIRLESEAGKGTTFYFTWPKHPEVIPISE